MSTAKLVRIDQFLENQFCLVVEPSASFASSIQAALRTLGVPSTRILMARRFEDAHKMIVKHKPRMLITEYRMDNHSGLDLAELQEKYYSGPFKVVFICTKDSSDSTVAEAAEEQVEAFLLKPFSAQDFDTKLNEVLERKINPTPYVVLIEEGKKLLGAKQFDAAMAKFIEAKAHSPKPSLACYYCGHTHILKGDRPGGLPHFQEGLKHQPLHYKCLIGAFDVLIHEKRYKEAFDSINLLKDNYPLTPKRLSQIFVVCVLSHHFDDVKVYYQKYQELDNRPPELVKVVTMALYTAGRHNLENKNVAEAAELFEMSAISAGRNLEFMEKTVNELVKYGAGPEAQKFLSKVSVADRATAAYSRLAFKVDTLILPKEQVAEKGRQLILTGHGNPEIYELVVRIMAEVGKVTLAESIITRAVTEHPEMRAGLYKILETASAGRS